jgi:hypothetical protein
VRGRRGIAAAINACRRVDNKFTCLQLFLTLLT